MSDQRRAGERTDEELRGGVIVGLVPRQHPRTLQEAARYAALFEVPLVVAVVDVARYTGMEDPTGLMAGAAIDLALTANDTGAEEIEQTCADQLVGAGVQWTMRRMAGDPATAIGELAKNIRASLIVVGTRRPGIGETLREWFNGSVAARLTHKQAVSVLVVPGAELTSDEYLDSL